MLGTGPLGLVLSERPPGLLSWGQSLGELGGEAGERVPGAGSSGPLLEDSSGAFSAPPWETGGKASAGLSL